MMVSKRRFLVSLLVMGVCLAALAADAAVIAQADSLYWNDRLEEARDLLKAALPNAAGDVESAEMLWRISRATLAIGDEMKEAGASDSELFAIYEEAEAYANQALAAAPVPRAYVYRASSIGRWGETKGPLNALSKAKPMRDDFTEVIDNLKVMDDTIAWYVLGQLYYKLPGWPISFGDLNTAISYSRKAIETIPAENLYHGHFKALAEMLWKRNLSASKRNSEIKSLEKEWKKSKGSTLDMHAYYEGAAGSDSVPFYSPVALNKMSDRQEAVMLLKYAIAKYDAWPFHSRADVRTYNEIQALLKDWGF